jgi:predicted Holliday junction resolvase-like endonuclease
MEVIMELTFNFSVVMGTLVSVMLSIIAWFIRELHQDFRSMQKEVSSLQHTANSIQLESRSGSELIKLQMGFLEWRMKEYEKIHGKNFKQEKHEKSS